MSTKIVDCTCKNEYQDEKYGKNKRVANKTAATIPTYRCAVCLKEHQLNK